MPGETIVVSDPAAIPRSRFDEVGAMMGLPPVTAEALWRGVQSASDDVAASARFVLSKAADWQLDLQRVAVGGFSAGARNALNAAFGESVAVAVEISLSGYSIGRSASAGAAGRQTAPEDR